MRIFVAGFQHETNTFAPVKAGFRDFEMADGWPGLTRGEAMLTAFEGINLPDPLLLQWLMRLILDPAEGMVVLGHPMLFAGWIGLLVTSLNLLPAGMLDGGHVVRALFGPRIHVVCSWLAVAAAALLGYWLMALVILLLLRRGHPGPLDDVSSVSASRIAVGLALLAVFLLSAVPLRVTPFR